MRKKLVVGNWKMNLTSSEGAALVEAIRAGLAIANHSEVGVCPPFLSIAAAKNAASNSAIRIGAQDVFWMTKGAFTGSISTSMLQAAGVEMCIVGHSETRGKFGKLEVSPSTVSYFGETDETVNLKLKALLYASITPILCVGETLAEREAGQTDTVIATQLEGGLAGIEADELDTLVIAYEPVWAIGTGKTCDTPEAERVCRMIRDWVAANRSTELSLVVRVLYGGSVKSANAKELFREPNIDGGLVGGASLDAAEFCTIIAAAN